MEWNASKKTMEIPQEILSRDGQVLPGILHIVDREDKNLVIFIHGFLSHKNITLFRHLSHGIAMNSFRFDFPLYFSDGTTFRYSQIEDVDDLQDVIHYLLSKEYCVIGLIGHSRGANILFKFAATEFALKNCPLLRWSIFLAGRAIMKEGPLKHLTPVQVQDLSSGTSQTVMWEVKVRGNDIVVPMTKLMLESFMSLTPLQDAARIIRKDLGILIVHGREDQQIPWCDAEALYKALIIPKKQLTLMAKAGHAYIGCLDELLEVIIKFIRVN